MELVWFIPIMNHIRADSGTEQGKFKQQEPTTFHLEDVQLINVIIAIVIYAKGVIVCINRAIYQIYVKIVWDISKITNGSTNSLHILHLY